MRLRNSTNGRGGENKTGETESPIVMPHHWHRILVVDFKQQQVGKFLNFLKLKILKIFVKSRKKKAPILVADFKQQQVGREATLVDNSRETGPEIVSENTFQKLSKNTFQKLSKIHFKNYKNTF